MPTKIRKKCSCKTGEFEAALVETQRKYQKLTILCTDAVIVIQHGAVMECNQAMSDLSGYGLEELTDTYFASFFHTEDIPVVESLGQETLENPDNVANLQARLCCKNGHQIKVAITESGMEVAMMSVDRGSLKNIKSTNTASTPPMSAALRTSLID